MPTGYHIQSDLTARLRSGMQSGKVTQTRLAADVGISRKHLYQVLAGRAQASVKLWQRLLDAVARYQGAPDMSCDAETGESDGTPVPTT